MAGFTFVVDDTSWDASNTAFTINDNTTRALISSSFPLPEPDVLYAQPVDADGDIPGHMRYRDRQGCQITFRIKGTSASNLETTLGQWSQKLAKVNREGGTLKATTPAGTSFFLPIRPGTHGVNFDHRYIKNQTAEVTWTFPAGPFWIGTAVQQTDTVETTLPYITKTATGPAGDVPALGKLLIDEDQAVDQWWVVWGIEDNSLYDITAASAALFYEAEGRTAMGGSATAVGPSGASGGGSNVMRNTALQTDWLALLSTQATGGGAHLTHVGTFKVYARVQVPTSNTGTVSVALQWSAGDFRRYKQEGTIELDSAWEGTWRLVDLGLATIPKTLSGTQRWEGRVLAKSTVAGDDIDIDYLLLIPTIRWGVARGVAQAPSPVGFVAFDNFNQTAGALTGKTAETGGTWAGAGDADDFSVETTDKTAQRVATSDTANIGRYCTLDINQAGVYAVGQAYWNLPSGFSGNTRQGVLARYVDTNNWAMVNVFQSGLVWNLEVRKRVAGTISTIKTVTLGTVSQTVAAANAIPMSLQIDSGGRFTATLTGYGTLTGQDADFVTGGTLATGDIGVYGENQSASVATLGFTNIRAAAYVTDSAMFASQSLEVRHDGVIREDSAGAIWQAVSDYQGDLLRVPVAGRESRSVRWIVKACRNDPATGPDSAIDDISARLTQYPLYLTVPSP